MPLNLIRALKMGGVAAPKMTVSMWEMTVSMWEITVSIWKMTLR